jgi:hypothetical protein
MFYTEFVSASPFFIQWLRNKLHAMTGVRGHISRDGKSSTQQLKYAKRESLHVLRYMYYAPSVICLRRKRLKIERMLRIVGESL